MGVQVPTRSGLRYRWGRLNCHWGRLRCRWGFLHRHWGRELNSIEPLIRQTARTARVGDDARESFDYLLDSGANYVVVLNADDTIAGIVTKTSVARSVAENLWGDSK